MFVPAGKASNNIIVVCKHYYLEIICKKLGPWPGAISSDTYILETIDPKEISGNHIHPRQRVKAKWNSDFRFGGKSAAASNKASHAASKSLLFSFVLDTFQAISVIFFNSTGTRRRISDLWFVGEENL